MEKNFFIFGISDLAQNLFYLLRQEENVTGFVVDKKYKTIDNLNGVPVYEYEAIDDFFDPNEVAIYLCIGYNSMNRYRKEKFYDIKKRGYEIRNYVHKSACVEIKEIGEGNLIFEQSYVGMYAKLGNANILYPKSMIAHHSQVGDFNFFSISSSVAGNVVIGNENFFGNNCTTKDGICVGNGNLVGAGAYVYQDIQNGAILVPARSVVLESKTTLDFL